MRSTVALAGIALLLATRPAPAQTTPGEMAVVAPEVEVRSGPGPKFHATGKLRQGERVVVAQESKPQPGWQAIKPPAESLSWIESKHVKKLEENPQIAAVIDEDVPVRPGSRGTNRPLDRESIKVKRGLLVVIAGPEVTTDSGTWLPIQPPPQDVRYVPAEAVKPAPVPANVPANLTSLDRARPGNPQVASGNPATTGQTTLYRTNPSDSGPTVSYAAQWSKWGQLRSTGYDKNGQPVYVLETRQAQVLLYVTTQAGFSLHDYIGKTVALYGPVLYPSNDYVRVPHMTASHVATVP